VKSAPKLGTTFALAALIWLAGTLAGLAHQGSTSYLMLLVDDDRIEGRWDVPVSDLELALKLDADGDDKVSAEELQKRFSEITSYVLRRLRFSLDGLTGAIVITNKGPIVEQFADGASLSLGLVVTNVAGPKVLEIDYRLMFDLKPLDRAFMQLEYRGVTQTAVFTVEKPTRQFSLEGPSRGKEFLSFTWHGVWHIWIGFDHILFLLALLLPAVLRFEQNQWQAVTGFRAAFFNVFKVVTAFTLAHSLTLSLAALQIVVLPSRWVESAIAASVLLAAINNIRAFFRGRVWMVAFAFGLIHGFGFANVLTELGLPRRALVLALVGFNLGVEAGQLAIVSVFLPIAYAVRKSGFYQHSILKVGSGLIAIVASLWLMERLFDWKILPV